MLLSSVNRAQLRALVGEERAQQKLAQLYSDRGRGKEKLKQLQQKTAAEVDKASSLPMARRG